MPITLPYNIANGQAIDATPVMANFNALAAAVPSSLPVPVNQGGTGDAGTQWATFTGAMAVTGGSGGAGTFTGRYKILGKTCFLSGMGICTAIGTGNSVITLSGIPFSFKSSGTSACREISVNGFMTSLTWGAGTSSITLFKYDNTFPATANGCAWPFSIVAEIQ